MYIILYIYIFIIHIDIDLIKIMGYPHDYTMERPNI